MTVGLGLLCCMTENALSFSYLDDQGIDRSAFIGDELRAYDAMRKHAERHGVLPKLETIAVEAKVTFPTFPSEPIGFWIERIESRRFAGFVLQASRDMEKAVASGDMVAARELTEQLYLKLGAQHGGGRVFDYKTLAPTLLEDHDKLQRRAGGLSGIPFGIPYLDEISGGAQPSDTVALVGRPSTGKSYFLGKMSLNCHSMGDVPLVVSLEMPAKQWARRILAMRAKVTATMLRLGRLSYWAREKVVGDIGSVLQEGGIPFYIMEGTLASSIEDVALRVRELRPSALYVDGAYLLRLKGKPLPRWERVTETAEWLKMIANEFKIPVIGTYQYNRRGPGLSNIAQSDAIAQLASIVIGLDDDDERMTERLGALQYKTLELLKGREGERGLIRVTYDMQRMVIQQDAVLKGIRLSREDDHEGDRD